jgi:RNAse (barnase) inhibitor barstar
MEKIIATLNNELSQYVGRSYKTLLDIKKPIQDVAEYEHIAFYDELVYVVELDENGEETDPDFEVLDVKVTTPIRIKLVMLFAKDNTLYIIKPRISLKQICEEVYDEIFEETEIRNLDFTVQSFDGVEQETYFLGPILRRVLDELNRISKELYHLSMGAMLSIMPALMFIQELEEVMRDFPNAFPDYKEVVITALERARMELFLYDAVDVSALIRRLKETL